LRTLRALRANCSRRALAEQAGAVLEADGVGLYRRDRKEWNGQRAARPIQKHSQQRAGGIANRESAARRCPDLDVRGQRVGVAECE
jgi:hypothetical protein